MQGELIQRGGGTLLILLWIAAPIIADDVLVSVNGESITQADLHLEAVLRRIPDEQLQSHHDELIEHLIEQQVIAEFVARRRTKVNPVQLDSQLEQIEGLIRRRGEEPEALFKRLGISRNQIRERLVLSLSWRAYVEQATSERQLREYFDTHRRQLDGTQLRAQQILLKADADNTAARDSARSQLAQIRKQIAVGDVSFAAAAKQHSQAPSATEGGDVGYFGYRGVMPAEFADAAFALQAGEISEPVESPFGVHLIKVTDERPGQLSLEDVRGQIIDLISRRMWESRIREDRPHANVERH